jgi:hypothetical protein
MIVPDVIDQFFTSSALLMRLLKRKKFASGSKIQQPIMYARNSEAGAWQGGFATLPAGQPEIVTKAEHNWAYYQCPIVYAETDKLKNMGAEEVADLAETVAQNALMSLKDTMGQEIYGDGSNNSLHGAKTLDGLSAIITHNANPSPGSYGNISRSSSTGPKSSFTGNAWWNGQSVAVNAGAVTRWTGAYNFSNASTVIDINKMNQMFTLCSVGDEAPDLIVMHPSIFAKLWSLLQANERITAGDSDVYKAGFRFIMLNGVPCVPDQNIDDAGKIYFLNTKYLFWRPSKSSDFVQTPLRVPSRQRIAIKYIFWDGNMTCSSPRMQGVLTGCTAA